ncbi:MAG: SurA N-terminal domain-containing protein [Peptoniphilaceae bacterium]|nr:SurA N-terminal domain-containing protein [Peptoniphilaceae bacterium]
MKILKMKQTTKNLKTKTSKILITAFLLFVTLTSCNSKDKTTSNIIASVDGKAISSDLYSKELRFYQAYYSKVYGESYLENKSKNGKTNDQILRDELVDSMIKDQVMKKDLESNNIKLDDNGSNILKNILADKLNGEDSLEANILALGFNENSINDILYNDSIRKAHFDLYLKKNKVKDKDVVDFYNKDKNLHRLYKYNVLVFDDESVAKDIKDKITDAKSFKSFLNKTARNYSIINSDFVYINDQLLLESKVKEKDKISNIFEHKGKYCILMINSYNENELLLKAKDIYLKNSYYDYLNRLIKESKIKVFV